MTLNDRATLWAPALAIVMATSTAGCQDRPEIASTVQRAVGTGAQGALGTRLEARAPQNTVAPTPALPAQQGDLSATAPIAHVEGSGADARLVVQADEHHVAPSSAHLGQRFGATWTDRDGQTLRYANYDLQGHVEGAPLQLHQAVEGEESVASSSLVAVGSEGYALAWVDGENGRVRFARLDANGVRRGASTIVHEGLEAPRSTRLVWNGHEFAVAVGLWQGVYFARINAAGTRVSDGSVMAEGETVRSVDELRTDAQGYNLAWTEEHDGRATQMHQRLGSVNHAETHPSTAGVGSRRGSHRVM